MTEREFSAGGVVIRRFRGRPFAAAVHVKKWKALALPKGHPDEGESMLEAATREVREETGLTAEPVEKLEDITYWYQRNGQRILKLVSFWLYAYRSGSIEDHDHEIDGVEWIPLEDLASRLEYPGEKKVAALAAERVGAGAL